MKTLLDIPYWRLNRTRAKRFSLLPWDWAGDANELRHHQANPCKHRLKAEAAGASERFMHNA